MSKTYSRGFKEDLTMQRITRAAKKTVRLSRQARKLRKGFSALVNRRGWSDVFPE